MMGTVQTIDAVGWAGAVILLIAYWAVTQRRLAADGWTYNAMNAIGSVGIAVNSLANAAYPSVVLNLIWLAFALWAMRAKPAA
jgi:hypothetical protein